MTLHKKHDWVILTWYGFVGCANETFYVSEKKKEETIVEKGITEEPVTNPIAEGNLIK